MRRVVSVSLGSPKGDFQAAATILGQEFEISRIGTNGDLARYAEMVRELDGQVDAIGLGGIDLYLYAGDRRYTIRDAARLAANARVTPVVDGSGLKNTLERQTFEWIQREGIIDFSDKNILVVCGVDRFGMAESAVRLGKSVVFGDLMFNCGVPIPIKSFGGLMLVARTLLPVVCQLPFRWIYPTGKKQEQATPKHESCFRWADVIAGDNKIIGRFMPPSESDALAGKLVITNTLTPAEIENLRARGVRTLVTGTWELPGLSGRTPGTNVIEGILITLAGKRPEEMSTADYLDLLTQLDWKPTVREL